MTTPIGSVQGLASGVQWRDLVDQIITIETSRAMGPVSDAIKSEQARIDGWSAVSAAVAKARETLVGLNDGTAFRTRSATVGTTASGRTLGAIASAAAGSPGRYQVEVENLAQSEKLTGVAVADATAALGVSGRFSINGASVTIEATDSLTRVRDKINAVNTGTAPSRVSAALSTVGGVARLTLNADYTGAVGIELADDRTGAGNTSTLEALGFTDATRSLNTGSDGRVRSTRISSATLAAATALGISVFPSPATVLVNGRALTVDLEHDSITDIVARINSLSVGSAKVETETDGAATWNRISIAGSVVGDGSAGSNLVLEALGMRVGGRSSNITQSVSLGTTLTGFGGATATGSTLLTDLGDGSSVGMQAGDVINLSGTDGAGNTVSVAYTVSGTDTLNDLMATLQGAFAGGRAASVSLVDGKLTFTDSTAGDSRLAVSLSAGLQGGDTLDFGAASTTYGRVRRLAQGEDARIRVDGALVTSKTNTVAGAIGGANLTLSGEEDDATFEVTIAATHDAAMKAVQDFATSYNDLLKAVADETKLGGRLAYASSARAVLGAMKGVLLSEQKGLATGAPYTRAGTLGIELQKNGQLKVNADKLDAALASDAGAVEALFAPGGASDNGSVQYVSASSVTPAGSFALVMTQAATRNTTLGAAFATYAAGGTPASMTVTSEASGKSATIAFVNGDTPAIIAARLQAAFVGEKIPAVASVEGGALRLTSTDFGTSGGFTIAYTDPGSEAPGTQLGIAAGTYDTGVNAAGTLDGVALTGSGQLLTAINGLVLRYTGSAPAVSTTVRYSRGIAGSLTSVANSVLANGSGTIALQQDSARTRVGRLEKREIDIAARLDRRRAMLVADFTRMEASLSRIQGQGNWLSSQISAMNGSKG